MDRRIAWIGLFAVCVPVAMTLAAKSPVPTASSWTSVEGMHADYVQAFVESEGFGKARITPMMRLMHGGILVLDGKAMRIGDVQLIGIAKHDPPVVYASGFMAFQHGDTDQRFLPMTATRRIDAQERVILGSLEKEQVAVTLADTSGPRAFGAIRAGSTCLECHRSKREGDLLGAFVYRLEPTQQ